MDFKQIQELIKLINKSNIGELTLEEKDFKITIKQMTSILLGRLFNVNLIGKNINKLNGLIPVVISIA